MPAEKAKPDMKDFVRGYKTKAFLTMYVGKAKITNVICEIRKGSTADMTILATWEKHFQQLGVPYAIFNCDRGKVELWKEKVVLDGF